MSAGTADALARLRRTRTRGCARSAHRSYRFNEAADVAVCLPERARQVHA
jgi:hypothetical protein